MTTDVPYERVSYDESRNLFIHDYAIAKSGFDLVTGPRMKLKVIPGKLTFDLADIIKNELYMHGEN
mgnify:FL=1